MNPHYTLRLLQSLHGALGWLALAALLHPAILLRNPGRRARWAVIFAAVMPTLAGSLGAAIYPAYRQVVRQDLFVAAPHLGWLFERKEHLGVAAVAFAWFGAVAHLGLARAADSERPALARLAHAAFVAAALCALLVASFGVLVAAQAGF